MSDFNQRWHFCWMGLVGTSVLFISSVGCQLGHSNRPDWITQKSADARPVNRIAIQSAVAEISVDRTNAATVLQTTKAESSKLGSAPASLETVSKNSPDTARLQTVAYLQGADGTEADAIMQLPFETSFPAEQGLMVSPLPASTSALPMETENPPFLAGLPIDFPTVLRLAGADNWNVRIAQERICEAAANYRAAQVLWLPSLNYGVGYNHHEGEIQATDGTVQTVSRGSLFVGGGSKIGNNPLAGGSGGPSRLTVDLSLADSIFQPLAARQLVHAERHRESRVFNDVMLQSSLAYFELVRAQTQYSVAIENQHESERVAKLTNDFVAAGKGTEADNNRMQVIVNQRRRDVVTAQAQIGIASAQLANVLQMDRDKLNPDTGLFAAETELLPIDLIAPEANLSALTDQAINSRQEIKEANLRAQAAQTQMKAEQWRPYLPNVSAGMSNGFFGGGTGGNLPKLDSRSDIDLQVTWELRNMGAGNRAARDVRRSQLNQSVYAGRQFKDMVANEVAAAYHQVRLQSESMMILQQNISESENALRLNIEAIRGLEGLPLESVQSLEALATARRQYLDAVVDYNQAQIQLWRSIGEPIMHEGI